MIDLIQTAVAKGAKIYSSISGGKDGQAMTVSLAKWGFNIEALVHADLGRIEWKESLQHCQDMAFSYGIPLEVVKRKDKRDMVDHWKNRMFKLLGTGKPFWSSKAQRYCTADMKRDPINRFFNSTKNNFIISCEGIRADESCDRAKKQPLSMRPKMCSTYYRGMTVEEAIANYNPKKKLVLTWFPIFNFTTADVWNSVIGTEGENHLKFAREEYQSTGVVPSWWPFHPAYVYGNERVSCMFCVLGSLNDLKNGAKHNPELLDELIEMERQSGFTFKQNFSLQSLKP